MSPRDMWARVWARLYPQLKKLLRQPLLWLGGLGGLALLAVEAALQLHAPATSATPAPAVSGLASPDATADWFGTFSLAISVCVKLALVIALIYASLWVVRRWQGGWPTSRKKQITLLESTRLSPRQALHLVRVGEKAFLVGATDQSITLLSEVAVPAPAEATRASAVAPAFAAALDRALTPDMVALQPKGNSGPC